MSPAGHLAGIAQDIFRAALGGAHAGRALTAALALDGDTLRLQPPEPLEIPLGRFRRVTLVGAGKAAAAMAAAAEDLLGGRIDRGLVVVKDGHGLPLRRVEVAEASHPLPDERGARATSRIMAWLAECGPDDLVLALLSGGGSALLPAPAPGITLAAKREVTRLLLAAGADIHQLNTVRQHLSASKGGQLAALAAPATVLVVMVSDVIGDDPSLIASGPFSPCETSFAEARRILDDLGVAAPPAVLARLQRGGERLPGPGHPAFARVHARIVASNRLALAAAGARAAALGLQPRLLGAGIRGEARAVAGQLAATLRDEARGLAPGAPARCLLAGGETTVTVRGAGRGGRNQEMALAAALALAGEPDLLFLSAGTDGTDGPTDAAGAWCDGATAGAARALGLDPVRHLQDNDSYTFFRAAGGLIVTGPTWTNVMDLQVMIAGTPG